MTTWAHGVSGNFNTAADWVGGVVPGGLDDAELTASGTYTVTSSQTNTVFGVASASGATLAVTNGTFTAADGTDGADNAGTISIGNNTVFIVGGASNSTIELKDSGIIKLNSTGSPTTLFLNNSFGSQIIDLDGGGKLTLSNNVNNLIEGASGTILNNQNDTISGAGTINIAALDNDHSGLGAIGVINADDSDPLTIKNGVLTNAGTVKATSTGGLIFQDETVVNTGGTVEATTSGSVISFVASSISNGTLSTVTGSAIVITSFSNTAFDPTTLTNAGKISLKDNAELTLGASNPINNTGAIALNAALGQTILEIEGSVALTGKGKVTLTDNPGNIIESNGSAATLTNTNNTISGAGSIGDSNTTLVNEGTIDGTGKNPLIIAAGSGVSNTGTIETSGAGGLTIASLVTNTSGTVATTASGAHIDLDNGGILAGTVKTVAGSTIDTVAGAIGLVVDATTFNNAGTLLLNNQSSFELGSNVDNTGSIAVESYGSGHTQLEINADVLLKGTGKVTLSGLNPWIISDGATASLINDGNTISGDGVIGDANLTLVNDSNGVIDANNSTSALVINTGSNTVSNAGTIEATAGGLLEIVCPIVNTGKIIADNAIVGLVDAPTGSGSLVIEGSGNMELGADTTQGVTFASGATGTLTLEAAATTTPTSVYDGTISGFGTGDAIDLAGLAYVAGTTLISTGPTFTAGPGGGSTTFTVANGTDAVQLTFAGNLTSHTFVLGEDAAGKVRITDPVSRPVAGGGALASVALLGSYIASAFPSALGGFTATTTDTAQSQLVLAHPHTG
jgi:hypothetical protein